jgi:hypothetical protein
MKIVGGIPLEDNQIRQYEKYDKAD